jgi:arginine decarboxylase
MADVNSMCIAANPARLRIDAWMRVRRQAEKLHALPGVGPDAAAAEERLSEELRQLEPFEKYWVFPGLPSFRRLVEQLERKDTEALARDARLIERNISEHGDRASLLGTLEEISQLKADVLASDTPHYFTALLVDDIPDDEADLLKQSLRVIQLEAKEFTYQLLVVDNCIDALAAALFNYEVQACVIRQDIDLGEAPEGEPGATISAMLAGEPLVSAEDSRGLELARLLRFMRPHLDLYLLTDESVPEALEDTHRLFKRVFYNLDVPTELHMTIIDGVRDRFETPFFNALKQNAEAPIGNFHALPIARGNSIFNSHWIRDMAEFYGPNIFMAETSSTTGGLDSLLAPTGTIKEAQDKAAKTWGSQRTYFSTNGTSTSNKIVAQALTRPGDIVLIDRNCHKSHHYGMVLAGAYPLYLDAYPLEPYAIYGAVPLRTIKERMLELERAGRLDAVRMLLLTNCTFDGIVYNSRRVMEEVLAIKPDICFLFDEAWYAFAGFVPFARERTAMASASALAESLKSEAYRGAYADYRARMDGLDPDDDSTWLDNRLMPDPDRARVRVYSTQSTHKSLSALRQGSMIHVWDQDFSRKAADAFDEAFLAHTSTSPNYQIIASLDLARRQADLEGYGMVSEVYAMAEAIRARVAADPLLSRYFRILTAGELIPAQYRGSGLASHGAVDSPAEFGRLLEAWESDEFILDPTRMTLYTADTGYNGNEFKTDVLMDTYGVQINKTSINSVLFIATIGVTWSSVVFLLDVLKRIAEDLERRLEDASAAELAVLSRKVRKLTGGLPHLPDFSRFHAAFRPSPDAREGDLRAAYYLCYGQDNREYVSLEEALSLMEGARELVSTSFVVPYPPGFPVLVPGQEVTPEIVEFMRLLDVKEIHGYRAELGLSVFTPEALGEEEKRRQARCDSL